MAFDLYLPFTPKSSFLPQNPKSQPHSVTVSFSPSTTSSSPMAPPTPQNFPHSDIKSDSSSHSCALFVFKLAVLAVLLLLAVPRFSSSTSQPSAAGAHFWELLHLLLVGIAVSYGLFSRKNPQLQFPISDETHNSISDLASMFHVSSSSASPDGSDPKASRNVIQAWNSQYNQTQSVVVVASGYRSLGLPVRSLKSTVSEIHGSGLSSFSEGSPAVSGNSGDLDLDLDSDRALPSPISWRSRSGRMEITDEVSAMGVPSSAASKPPLSSSSDSVSSEISSSTMADRRHNYMESGNVANSNSKMEIREEMDSVSNHPQFSPPSIDETECESPESESCRSDASFSSNASSLYSPLQSVSSQSPDSNIQGSGSKRTGMRKECTYSSRTGSKSSSPDNQSFGEFEKEKSVRRSSPPTMSINREATLNKSSHSKYSNSTLMTEKNAGREFPLDRKCKASSMGKSVRTIRCSSRTEDKSEKMHNKYDSAEKVETRTRARGYDKPPRSASKQNNQAFSTNENSERDNVGWKFDTESEEDDRKDSDMSEEEVEEELVARAKSNVRADPGEVDKKADEFIAKFREQIRLQKMASIDLSGELSIKDNYFR